MTLLTTYFGLFCFYSILWSWFISRAPFRVLYLFDERTFWVVGFLLATLHVYSAGLIK